MDTIDKFNSYVDKGMSTYNNNTGCYSLTKGYVLSEVNGELIVKPLRDN